jgi:hypothetical protein
MRFPTVRANLASWSTRSGRILTLAFLLILSSITGTVFFSGADKNKSSSRPTVRVAAGNRYDFCQYAAGNGSTYGPNCKLKIDDIQKAWADVSDVVIDGIFEVKRTDPTQRVAAVFVVNKLTIENDGKIVTNGNTLYIFANEFVGLNNAAIISFEPSNLKATSGAPKLELLVRRETGRVRMALQVCQGTREPRARGAVQSQSSPTTFPGLYS